MIAIASMFALFMSLMGRNSKFITYYLVFVLFVCVNSWGYFKYPEGDWAWYFEHYQFIAENGLRSYFLISSWPSQDLDSLLNVKPKQTEPFLYIIFHVISLFGVSDHQALSLIISALFYTQIIFASFISARAFSASELIKRLIIIYCVLAIPNIVLVLQLVRQQISVGFVFIAFSFLINKNHKLAILFSIISVLTHNASIIVCLCMFISYYLPRMSVSLVLSAAVGFSAYIFIEFFISFSGRIDHYKNDGMVGVPTVALDYFLLFPLLWINYIRKVKIEIVMQSVTMCIVFFSVYAAVIDIPLLALRIYFLTDFIQFVIFVSLCYYISIKKYSDHMIRVMIFLAITVGFIYLIASAERSRLNYYSELYEVFLWPIY